MRGLPISRGKLYPGYRLFRRLRFVVGGNRRERSSNERVARPLDAPLVFARRRFIEILFLWPARARADARRGSVRERGEMRADDRPKETRESPLLLISSAFLPPSRAGSVSLYLRPHRSPPSAPHRGVFHVLSRYAALFHPRVRACSLSRARNLARSRSRSLGLRPALFALRPFNSIATLFYNAAAPCSAKSRWFLTLCLTRWRAISRSYMNDIPSYFLRLQGMRVKR